MLIHSVRSYSLKEDLNVRLPAKGDENGSQQRYLRSNAAREVNSLETPGLVSGFIKNQSRLR